MNRAITILILMFLGASISLNAQDWPNLNKYREDNQKVINTPKKRGEKRVVYIGDSITEMWKDVSPEYFKDNRHICRGIGGQTTPQMLVRFRQDVVDLNADVVVILAGTNDVAGNTGKSSPKMILDNIKSMCEIAKQNKIDIILCSILPAKQYNWNKSIHPDKIIPVVNDLLKEYAKEEKIEYVDLFSIMVDTENPNNKNGLKEEFTYDAVHLTKAGYKVMEENIKP